MPAPLWVETKLAMIDEGAEGLLPVTGVFTKSCSVAA